MAPKVTFQAHFVIFWLNFEQLASDVCAFVLCLLCIFLCMYMIKLVLYHTTLYIIFCHFNRFFLLHLTLLRINILPFAARNPLLKLLVSQCLRPLCKQQGFMGRDLERPKDFMQ